MQVSVDEFVQGARVESAMQLGTLRPTFSQELPWSLDEAVTRMRTAKGLLEQEEAVIKAAGESVGESMTVPGRIQAAGYCLDFYSPESQQTLWSPYLSVQLQSANESNESGKTILHGRFSPRPAVWTFVMFCYATMGTLVGFGLMFAYVQHLLGQWPWAWILVGFAGVWIVAIHVASRLGQSWSREQMHELRARLQELVALCDRAAVSEQAASSLPAVPTT